MNRLVTVIGTFIVLTLFLLMSSTLALLIKIMLASAALLISVVAIFVVAVAFKLISAAVEAEKTDEEEVASENKEKS